MLGFDVGFDVVELADFFAGFACVDLEHDDFWPGPSRHRVHSAPDDE
jgi:hypothetical protein